MSRSTSINRTAKGWQLPGIANLHSHAFQRAMAGMAERRDGTKNNGGAAAKDSFWTWRETMYRFAARFDPDTLHAVASQLYLEMLEAGYTRVCEFHYLHHAPDGRPYADPAVMSRALIAAARDTGIRLTLLPVLYMTGGFDGRALAERQRRFGHTVDSYLQLLATLRNDIRTNESGLLQIGCALHSLRAVPAESIDVVVSALSPAARIHIHIAEQTAEVDECLAMRGARPVQWLLDHAPVEARWTLVHATHIDADEIRRLARSGATVALCPTTEANLGDGLFPLRDYLDAGGTWGIGSDSNSSVSPVEELRWLEYGQRLLTRQRNVAAQVGAVSDTSHSSSVGETLLRGVSRSAPDATGFGHGDDHLLLDEDAPAMVGATDHDAIDRWIFAGNRNVVREVVVAGRRLVENGLHADRDAIHSRYRDAIARLLAE